MCFDVNSFLFVLKEGYFIKILVELFNIFIKMKSYNAHIDSILNIPH